MATDYILFIHGVNTREQQAQPSYANALIKLLDRVIATQAPTLNPQYIPLYWGDTLFDEQQKRLNKFRASSKWNQLWFRNFRSKQLMQFVGDAALYINRHVGTKVVEELARQIEENLPSQPQPDDRLHIVAHSWGTVILFDILFAGRWDLPTVPGSDRVRTIRQRIFGVEPERERGIRLASIHTLGSPLALFNLIDLVPDATGLGSTYDIAQNLQKLLQTLYRERGQQPLPWYNFIHPSDPFAWTLKELMVEIVGSGLVEIEDIVTKDTDLTDLLMLPFRQSPVSLLINGGDAHGSYWRCRDVVRQITAAIASNRVKQPAIA
jgi:hypothetical protein